MKTLYFDIISGISGDMTLATLLQKGIDIEALNAVLSTLLQGTVILSLEDKKVSGIAVKHLNIHTKNCKTPHRDFYSISALLKNSQLPEKVVADAINIFQIIADAECKMHDQPIEKVHFHEVGAIDSIIDIVGAAYCMHQIQPDRVLSSSVVIGNGLVKTEHGLLPVPAPATMEILQVNNIPLKRIEISSELTTPTGAAIIAYYTDQFTHEFEGQIKQTAYSTGTKQFEHHPNMLRVLTVESDGNVPQYIHVIETNIDDDTGENLGHLIGALMSNGALDASYSPIFGKKNRPAYQLTVMAKGGDMDRLISIILSNSSSAGVRHYPVKRVVMNRQMKTVSYEGDDIRIKVLSHGDIQKASPEWEDVVAVSKKHQMTPTAVYRSVLSKM